MFQKAFLPLLLFLFTLSISAQILNQPVAKIGKKNITAEEFLHRYELSPKFVGSVKGLSDELKREFLFTMIAEKLMSLEAESRGLDTTVNAKLSIESFKEMFLRDALFRKEIESKSEPTMQALLNELSKSLVKLVVKKITTDSLRSAENIYKILKKGLVFDSLFAEYNKGFEEKNTLLVQYGQLQKIFEDTLYALKTGEFTPPILVNQKWNIFYVSDRIDSSLKNTAEYEHELTRVRTAMRQREMDLRADEYLKAFFGKKKVNSSGSLVKLLANLINEIAIIKKNVVVKDTSGRLVLTPLGIDNLLKSIPVDSLSKTYIVIDKRKILLKEYLFSLNVQPLVFAGTDLNSITSAIYNNTKRFIEFKLLSDHALKQNLENDTIYNQSMSEWSDYLLSQTFQRLFADSAKIPEEEILHYYNKRYGKQSGADLINVAEIVTEDLDAIPEILEQMKNRKDIQSIVLKHSKKESTRLKGGETGFINVEQYGEFSKSINQLNPGDVYGPVKTADGYLIVKVLGKKKGAIEDSVEFSSVYDKIKRDLSYAKFSRSMINTTVELAEKYGVEVDSVLLNKLPVTEINGVYYRFIGFGGRILATPMTVPYTDWVEDWRRNKKLNP